MMPKYKHYMPVFLCLTLVCIFFVSNCKTPDANRKETKSSPEKTVYAEDIQAAIRVIVGALVFNLPPGSFSLTVLPPLGKTLGNSSNVFEARVSEGILNQIKPFIPANYRLIERANLKKIFKDSIVYGGETKNEDLIDSAGVDIYLIGTYTILKDQEKIELLYRAVVSKDGEILATTPVVYLPSSVLEESDLGLASVTGFPHVGGRYFVTIEKIRSQKCIDTINDSSSMRTESSGFGTSRENLVVTQTGNKIKVDGDTGSPQIPDWKELTNNNLEGFVDKKGYFTVSSHNKGLQVVDTLPFETFINLKVAGKY